MSDTDLTLVPDSKLHPGCDTVVLFLLCCNKSRFISGYKYLIWRSSARFSRSSHLSWSSARRRTLCFCKASGSVNASPYRAAEGHAAHDPGNTQKIKSSRIRGGLLRENPCVCVCV